MSRKNDLYRVMDIAFYYTTDETVEIRPVGWKIKSTSILNKALSINAMAARISNHSPGNRKKFQVPS